MRRLLAVAAIGAAGLGMAVPSAPASAAYQCHGYANSSGQGVGVCAGSWCPDKCFIVASTYCHGIRVTLCPVLDGLGSPPGGVR